MSNKRALFKESEYVNEIAKCDYIIEKTKNYKCKRDFAKRRLRLIKELEEYHKNIYSKNKENK